MHDEELLEKLRQLAKGSDFSETLYREQEILQGLQRELTKEPPIKPWTAPGIFEQVKQQIQEFEQDVDQDHDVGILLQLGGEWRTIQIYEVITLWPQLIVFKGLNETKEQVRLIQHIHQLNLLLVKVRRLDTVQPKRKIGFVDRNNAEKQ